MEDSAIPHFSGELGVDAPGDFGFVWTEMPKLRKLVRAVCRSFSLLRLVDRVCAARAGTLLESCSQANLARTVLRTEEGK